ncbi:hypothetical protein Scep_012892 [Stephania cephalantha]|uniref:Uncharacterized protein n=1 Tax=Stephania cephalantha TaxID=152367 RepID=A0AAP0JFY0_9MAGN
MAAQNDFKQRASRLRGSRGRARKTARPRTRGSEPMATSRSAAGGGDRQQQRDAGGGRREGRGRRFPEEARLRRRRDSGSGAVLAAARLRQLRGEWRGATKRWRFVGPIGGVTSMKLDDAMDSNEVQRAMPHPMTRVCLALPRLCDPDPVAPAFDPTGFYLPGLDILVLTECRSAAEQGQDADIWKSTFVHFRRIGRLTRSALTLRDWLGGPRGLRPGGAQFVGNWGRQNFDGEK